MALGIDKRALIKALLDDVERALDVMRNAANAARDAATHEEMKAENEKDTRAIEAGYLAKGQSVRLAELEKAKAALKSLQAKPQERVDVGAVVTVRERGRASTLFIAPAGGGLRVKVGGVDVSVVTPESPLGDALVGMETGDTAEIEAEGAAPARAIDVVEVA
jgi:transcription elongation GreA/GreB family factor